MSPKLRQAMHQALDHVLDALSEEASLAPKPSKRSHKARPPVPMPDVSAETKERVRAKLIAKGLI
jgi:hypothetical protein